MSDWYMGQLAAQDQYDPRQPSPFPEPAPAPEQTPHEIAARRLQYQHRKLPQPGSSNMEAVAEALIPQEPWEYGLAAALPGAGLIGRGLAAAPRGIRMGALAAGIGTTATEAEAGKAKLAKGLTGFAPGETARLIPQGWQDLRKLDAPFPQYAEQYPAAGPPVMKPKNKPTYEGEMYPEKLLTPEAEAFAKAREKIQANVIRKGDYQPYFDPAKRFDVDPKNYPGRNVDTLTLKPVRQETIDQYLEVINAPQTKQLLRGAYKKGQELGNANDWYAMGQLEAEYIKVLGEKKGREAFLDEFATSMAATTSGQKPGPNFMMSHYFETLRKKGEPIPAGDQFPTPVGGRRPAMNIRDYEQMRSRGGYAGLGADQPKMHNFSRSFIGDLTRGVMDEQMSSGMLAHILTKDPAFADRARKSAYGLIEQPLHDVAKKAGVDPGNYQDVAWAGFKNEGPGKPMISEINDSIERTHLLTGTPRSEIMRRGLVLKEIPMYGAGGVAATGVMGELARRDQYQQ